MSEQLTLIKDDSMLHFVKDLCQILKIIVMIVKP